MLQQGRIIWASVPRPDGSPGKPRTAVIVTATAEINDTDPFVVVAITSAFQEPLRDAEVRLPFHPQGGGRIGPQAPTVAVCDWLVELRKSQVLQEVGSLPTILMIEIVEKTRSYIHLIQKVPSTPQEQ
ncbi:MAG TPA: type II toxin-antitoxin system PemK/MazF family toxin [Gemmataceae bacterium]|nr:type II toxin-antitoxin system PemK/MazF family toxin [Gemmataceae bacterium]